MSLFGVQQSLSVTMKI